MPQYSIIIADDHSMFRSAVRKIIQEHQNYAVVGEATDGLALLELLKKVKPDLIILDISMPNLRGIEAAREIKQLFPEVKILILTMHSDQDYLGKSISAGVEGYLLKQDADTELIRAIKKVLKGGNYLSPLLYQEVSSLVFQKCRTDLLKPAGECLTAQELKILKLIAEGKSGKEIGALLYLSVRTVFRHRANLMKKLQVKNTAELVKYAMRRGLLED